MELSSEISEACLNHVSKDIMVKVELIGVIMREWWYVSSEIVGKGFTSKEHKPDMEGVNGEDRWVVETHTAWENS